MSYCFPDYLSAESLCHMLQNALDEDVGSGDITSETLIPEDHLGYAVIIMREGGVIAGVTAAEQTFKLVDASITCQWAVADGDSVNANTTIGSIAGPLRSILTAERVCLNVMQRMSGIATLTAETVDRIKEFPARIRDTRKTMPGLRLLDKWSVLIGGGTNHRIGLYDQILIKDNHIEVVGGLAESVKKASSKMPNCKIDVEAQTMGEVNEALSVAHLIDVLLLDNMAIYHTDGSFDTSLLKQAVDRVGGQIKTEATGGITLKTAYSIAATGVDYLSCGALTHSVRAIDIALSIAPL